MTKGKKVVPQINCPPCSLNSGPALQVRSTCESSDRGGGLMRGPLHFIVSLKPPSMQWARSVRVVQPQPWEWRIGGFFRTSLGNVEDRFSYFSCPMEPAHVTLGL